MRKQATAEQKAKAEARRARFKGLAKQIGALSEDQRRALAAKCWPSTVEGHALSVTNACLLALQLEGVSLVGGFRQWIKAGRVVRKGEHGLSIWVPGGARGDVTGASGESGEAGEGEMFFLMGTVFDVSQTEELAEQVAA